jgi:hypothetical protein
LFESPEEASAAAEELDQATIGTRYVELSVISYGDYLNFNGPPGGRGGGYGGGKTTRLSNYVSSETEHRALVMRGLPYRIEGGEIMTFFDGFGGLTVDEIHIEEQNGHRTGSALILFESENVAQDAKSTLNKREIGSEGRYVELYDSNDTFMRKICNLPLE